MINSGWLYNYFLIRVKYNISSSFSSHFVRYLRLFTEHITIYSGIGFSSKDPSNDNFGQKEISSRDITAFLSQLTHWNRASVCIYAYSDICYCDDNLHPLWRHLHWSHPPCGYVRATGSKRDARWVRYSPFPGVLEARQRGEMVGAANVAVQAGLPGGQVRSRREQLKWGSIVCRAGAGIQAWKTNKTNVQNMPDKPQGALKNGTLTKLNLHKTALNGNKRLLWQHKLNHGPFGWN